MSSVAVKVPAAGESVVEAMISEWLCENNTHVERDQPLVELETDKASMEVLAEVSGTVQIKVEAGEVVKVGQVIAEIGAESGAEISVVATSAKEQQQPATQGINPPRINPPRINPPRINPPPAPPPAQPARHGSQPTSEQFHQPIKTSSLGPQDHGPAVAYLSSEQNINLSALGPGGGRGGRLTKGDVLAHLAQKQIMSEPSTAPSVVPSATKNKTDQVAQPTKAQGSSQAAATLEPSQLISSSSPQRLSERQSMTMIRRRIAERLLSAKQETAMLTTFNDVDMSAILALRSKYKEDFQKRYGIKLGFMGFFIKASVQALQAFPKINSFIEGTDIISHNFNDIGVAVSTEKGLVVPVIRNTEHLSLAEIENKVLELATKARDKKLQIEEMSGGTFTITNGGVFGSLLSTPILNPPQSAILGMHKTQMRPVVLEESGEIAARPMMYLALSYDHRIVDGKEAVQFLVKIKESIEDPSRLLLGL